MPTIPSTTTSDALREKVKEALRQQLLQRAASTEAPEAPPPAVEEKKEEVVEAPLVCGKGQVPFTSLLPKRSKLPKGWKDFAVTVLDLTTIHAKVRHLVPALKSGYNIQVEEAYVLLQAWESKDKTLISGPTGSGKSSLVEYCAALTNRPLLRINMTGDIESSVIFGQLKVKDASTVWEDGPAAEACLYGAVLCIDEWDVTPPEIFFGFQWLLEENGKLYLKEKPGESADKLITPHDNFRFVALGNTIGQGDESGKYAGTNVQNNASIDRFQTTIVLDYLSAEHEQRILQDNTKVDKPTIVKMVQFAGLVRQSYKTGNCNLTMSPRTLLNWGHKIPAFGIMGALKVAFLNKMRESDTKVCEEFVNKVFGKI